VTAPRPLSAGPFEAQLEAGALRHLRWRDIEILRGAAYLFRDRDWGTAAGGAAHVALEGLPPSVDWLAWRQAGGMEALSTNLTPGARGLPLAPGWLDTEGGPAGQRSELGLYAVALPRREAP
jgi:hypothetical protein